MLTGLLFATHDHDDRLTATLPFCGVTLIEHQARLLVTAGCSHIVIMVARLTPALLGAVNRIGRRGVAVDAVRHASEAADKLHPLARVLMLADGLITTQRVVDLLASEGGDALLVVRQADAATGLERVGGAMAWAGIARLDPRRLAEATRLPRDYDLQSSLVRIAEQARAVHVLLPADATRQGHGIEHDPAALAQRGKLALATVVSDRRGWFDRGIVAPLARVALPAMVARRWPGLGLTVASAVPGIAGPAAIALGWTCTGLALSLLACIGLALGATLSGVRDERQAERFALAVGLAIPALAVLILGAAASGQRGDLTALAVAGALVTLAALAERARPLLLRAWWWGSPPAYLFVVAAAAVLRWPLAGVATAAAYAAVTLAAAIERLRRQP